MRSIIKKILNILFIIVLVIFIIYFLYSLLAISYLILNNFYILDNMTAKSRFLLYYLLGVYFVLVYSAWEADVYSTAMDSGELPHAMDTESIQAYHVREEEEFEYSLPIENMLLVRLARTLKSILDTIILFFLYTLFPTFFKLIFAFIAMSYGTCKGVVFSIYTECRVKYKCLRSEFIIFQQSYGISSMCASSRSKLHKLFFKRWKK